jgi:integrase
MNKHTNGLWRERVKLKNGKYKDFYGHTKSEVMRKVMEHQETEEKGRLFSDVAADWWEQHSDRIAFTTAKSYKPALARTCEFFANRRINTILPTEISRHVRLFARDHAAKTVHTQMLVYNLIFTFAVDNGDVQSNAARDVSVPNNLPKRKVTMPSSEDIARIKASSEHPFGLFALMALYTGMRRGELLALHWEDVDRKNGVIRVNKSVYFEHNRPKLKPPKTATSVGAVPILSALSPHLPSTKHGVIFNQAGEYMPEKYFKTQWDNYCRDIGISCTPHQLRHAYATMLYENDIPPAEAQILLRHAQYSTTMDIYTDIREQKQKQVFDRVKNVDIS